MSDTTLISKTVIARQRDALARERDLAADARDTRAQDRDQHARTATRDLDQEFPARFLSAADRDDAAGDRADADGDRIAARLDLEEVTASLVRSVDDVRMGVDFQEALADRTVIGIAQGLLMADPKLTAADAFELLRRRSFQENRRIRDIARDVLYRHVVEKAEC